MPHTQLITEFNRQVENLLQKKYPESAGISPEEFLSLVEPLKKVLDTVSDHGIDFENGTLPFVIVVKSDLVGAETMMSRVEKDGKNGVTILRPHSSTNFKTIEEVHIPSSTIYLLCDIDRGKDTINIPPQEAMRMIISSHRSPLTVDEGIAIVTHYPEFLQKNNCFSLLASRTGTDQRVPAIWINGKKEPNLGWCWDGNPHTWLGSASCSSRTA